MRIVHEITLAIFSLLILIFVATYSLILLGVVDVNIISHAHEAIMNSSTSTNIMILAINTVLIIFALIGIFGDSAKDSRVGEGIVVQSEKGNLLISKETLRNLIASAIKGFKDIEINSTQIELTPQSKLKINVVISISENIVIKETTNHLQSSIKDIIKKSSDIDVEVVNVSIKGIIKHKSVDKSSVETVGGSFATTGNVEGYTYVNPNSEHTKKQEELKNTKEESKKVELKPKVTKTKK